MILNKEEFAKQRTELDELARRINIHYDLTDENAEDLNTLHEYRRRMSQPKAYIELEGVQYAVVRRIGRGEESNVYIIHETGKPERKLALKVYNKNDRDRIIGDLNILQQANHAKPYLNMPIIVNVELAYMISPALLPITPSQAKKLDAQILELEKNLELALLQDGLVLGDNYNDGNYVLTPDDRLLRIDFGSLKMLAETKPNADGPKLK